MNWERDFNWSSTVSVSIECVMECAASVTIMAVCSTAYAVLYALCVLYRGHEACQSQSG